MEVDLVVTSACLTGQVDLGMPTLGYNERLEEWLGLPMALQAVWKTRAMLLTFWEVEELPAMIWVVELVRGLTRGFPAGAAQKRAQDKVRTVTREQVEAIWLAETRDRLSPERWDRVETSWRETSRTGGQHPFSSPVHWASFVLVGDPAVTISPRR
jgi:CHAT domain-containing protein